MGGACGVPRGVSAGLPSSQDDFELPSSVGTSGVRSSLMASVPYARVYECVGNVNQQVEYEHRDREDEDEYWPQNEVRQTYAEHRRRHRSIVELRVLPERGERPEENADDEGEQVRADAERGRDGERPAQYVVDGLVLILERVAEVE